MGKRILIFSFLLISFFGLSAADKAKYIFLFIGDGMGTTQVELANSIALSIGREPLAIKSFPYTAATSTYSANSKVTDSSASGTAIACGVKTNNAVLGLDTNMKPLTSSAEYAKSKGMKVGVMSSVDVNHATPAAFYGHSESRANYYQIALQMLDSNFDFLGGYGIMQADNKDSPIYKGSIYKLAKEKSYNVVQDRKSFDKLSAGDERPIVLLRKMRSLYAIDGRDSDGVGLDDLTKKAIEILDNDKGFFIMVEGGLIDWACHCNDAVAMYYEISDMDAAVKSALEFAKKHPDETLIIVTADHETGGLSYDKESATTPLADIIKQKHSQNQFVGALREMSKSKKDFSFEDCAEYIEENFGLKLDGKDGKGMSVSAAELEVLKKAFDKQFSKGKTGEDDYIKNTGVKSAAFAKAVLHCVNSKYGIRWSTQAHTGTDVSTSAYGVGASNFTGKIDNTDICKIIKTHIGGVSKN